MIEETVANQPARAVAPATWFVRESLELTAAELKAHVIASAEPVVPGTDLEAFVDGYGRLLQRTLPAYVELGVESSTFAGARPAMLRRLEWTPPGGHRVTQLQVYAIDGDQAYVATATTQSAWFDRVEARLRRVLDSISIEGPAGVAMPAVHESGVDPLAQSLEKFERGTIAAAVVAMDKAPQDWGTCSSAWQTVRDRFSGS
jgi:hypothetical protein